MYKLFIYTIFEPNINHRIIEIILPTTNPVPAEARELPIK
jgi:hypothetical protein